MFDHQMSDIGFRLEWRLSEKRIKENIVDDEFEEGLQGEVPRPFEYREPSVKDEWAPHGPVDRAIDTLYISSKILEVYPIEVSNTYELPALQYVSLDIEREEIRLLILLPHDGHPGSIVQCGFFMASLIHDHYCYFAIRNTLGHPNLETAITVNG
ncbi:hypothetical protein K469DRAFT_713197 [Zopfia rhizophila CBS 207.26]|uniref:Uncharacterized protein n=1 Tax=Zopfia rhizophila CBS 207.26 TaxID=1314779 RepID=A0A6A6DR63_9PEZI|nr:hypothetical protein K469DRAFT_713197 [Zopfia rhizophila CBS 207.26]